MAIPPARSFIAGPHPQVDQFTESIYWEYIHLLVNNGMMSFAKQIGSKMEKFIEGELGIPVKEKLRLLFGA